MNTPFAHLLTGGHPNSLGRTEEVVGVVLADEGRLDELFATMGDPDEVVRMRVGDALEKVCRTRPNWFMPHIEHIVHDLGNINQPSVQWHVAQMLQHLHEDLSGDQGKRALRLLQRNLAESSNWIVFNITMDVLTDWSANDSSLAGWLAPQLERLCQDKRKSVARRASLRLVELTK